MNVYPLPSIQVVLNDRPSAFLPSAAELTDPNTPLSDGLVSNYFGDLTINSEPSMFDDATDLYLTQPTFEGSELASNDFCPLSTSPASRRTKFRKRENGIQCTSSDTTSTSPPTLSFPTPEEIEELLQTQNDDQKKWCSKRVIPGFSNIPVCQSRDPIYRQSAWNNELPPALREAGLLSSVFDVVGYVRKHISFLEYTMLPSVLLFIFLLFCGSIDIN